MDDLGVRVKNTSEYWYDYQGELGIYYSYSWNIGEFSENWNSKMYIFLEKYYRLTHKYGILIPILESSDELFIAFLDRKKIEISPNEIPITSLYCWKNKFVFPTVLYVQLDQEIKKECIVNIQYLKTLDDYYKNQEWAYGSPVSISFYNEKSNGNMLISILIDNDAFFLQLNNNPKVNETPYIIDNSELAYLNTTRLNSFLRDFKLLCFEFGAYKTEVENYYKLNQFSEDGIAFNNEIIFYEDIYDLLPDEHKYKEFEKIHVEIDDTNYKKYLESRSKMK